MIIHISFWVNLAYISMERFDVFPVLEKLQLIFFFLTLLKVWELIHLASSEDISHMFSHMLRQNKTVTFQSFKIHIF